MKISEYRAMKKPKRSKMRNVITVVDGIKWKSAKQARRYRDLKLMQEYGDIRLLRWEVTYHLIVNNIEITTYRCDFEYVTRAGDRIVEDVKPTYKSAKAEKEYKATGAYKMFALKKRMMAAIYGIDVKEV
jgi:hypothetical protein